MDIILETPGTRVGKRNEMLKISVPNKKNVEVPLREVESIIVDHNVQISTQALESLSSNAINIVYTKLGKPFGLYTPFTNVGTVFTRRQQLKAYEDWRGYHLATRFIFGTLENKRRLLLYFAKNRATSNPAKATRLKAAAREIGKLIEELSKLSNKSKNLKESRMTLMGYEGKATAIYFMEYGNLFSSQYWMMKRTRRPPRDPVNSLLSLGYTVLLGHITTAIASAGLELYGGFLHSDRSGKPSLALDLLEEFRQPIVDKLVVKLILKRRIKEDNFDNSLSGFRLKDDKKAFFYRELRKEIKGTNSYADFISQINDTSKSKNKKGINYKQEMIRQARQIARYLIGATSEYKPFLMKW